MAGRGVVAGWFDRLDHWVVRILAAHGIRLLRISLAIVFVWFGALKVAGVSPVEDLVIATAYWVPAAYAVVGLGIWEILVGLGLLFRVALRLTLLMFWLQMAGTFLTFVMHPGITFQSGNPFLLTTEGEFVVKNLVLIAAGMVIGSTVQRPVRSDAHPVS